MNLSQMLTPIIVELKDIKPGDQDQYGMSPIKSVNVCDKFAVLEYHDGTAQQIWGINKQFKVWRYIKDAR